MKKAMSARDRFSHLFICRQQTTPEHDPQPAPACSFKEDDKEFMFCHYYGEPVEQSECDKCEVAINERYLLDKKNACH